MGRDKKNTVDYFPHTCKHNMTMHSLKKRYGTEGYTLWFCILEMLGSTNDHFLDCKDANTWIYLVDYTLVQSDKKAREIIGFLTELGALDKQLWDKKQILWSDKFVENLEDLYKRRKVGLVPEKPNYKCIHKKVSKNLNDSKKKKVKYSKVNNTKVKEDIYSVYLKKWNDSKIQKRGKAKLNHYDTKRIDTALKYYSEEELLHSVENYGLCMNMEGNLHHYQWSLEDFFRSNYRKFLEDKCLKDLDKNNNGRAGKPEDY